MAPISYRFTSALLADGASPKPLERRNTITTTRPEFPIQCPRCPAHISLPGTTLAEIVRGRKVSTTGAPWLVLVCPECKAAFRYDYRNRRGLEAINTPAQSTGQSNISWFLVLAECADGNCKSQMELIAIRSADTAPEQLSEERKTWTADDIYCEHGHPIVCPR